jgi:hypothetical protein
MDEIEHSGRIGKAPTPSAPPQVAIKSFQIWNARTRLHTLSIAPEMVNHH